MKYVCDVCGYEYDEALGDPDHGIAPGTKWEDLPADFECPLCGGGMDHFSPAYRPAPRARRAPLPRGAPCSFLRGYFISSMARPTSWTTARWVSSKRCI